jgi:hypothetical protein
VFARLIAEYGGTEDKQMKAENGEKLEKGMDKPDIEHEKKGINALMQVEERNFGSVEWDTYAKYLRFAGGLFWAPVILGLLAFVQGAAGMCRSGICFVIHRPMHPAVSGKHPIFRVLDGQQHTALQARPLHCGLCGSWRDSGYFFVLSECCI